MVREFCNPLFKDKPFNNILRGGDTSTLPTVYPIPSHPGIPSMLKERFFVKSLHILGLGVRVHCQTFLFFSLRPTQIRFHFTHQKFISKFGPASNSKFNSAHYQNYIEFSKFVFHFVFSSWSAVICVESESLLKEA